MKNTADAGQSEMAQSDLAQLRAIAEEGRNRPLLGGRQFIVFGAAIAVASLLHALIAMRVLSWPPMSISAVWFGVMFAAAMIGRTMRRGGTDRGNAGSRVEREVWRAAGFVLGTIAVGIFAYAFLDSARSGSPDAWFLFVLMPPIVFGVYAIALAASAAASQANYLKPYAALSVVFLVLTLMLSGTVWQFVATATGAIVVSVLPGLILLARERAIG